MREPAFWWRGNSWAGAALAPLGALYGAVAASRMRRAGADAGVPVICVGNLTLGGSGKTPAAIAIARILANAGQTPFFLTRGYGGAEPGPALIDEGATAQRMGDEALLLARHAPTIVSRDRPAGASLARRCGASIIVMDDGLQNPALRKTISLAMIDARRGIGNGRIFPAGPLRAPLSAQLERVDAAVIVGDGTGGEAVRGQLAAQRIPMFNAALVPDATMAAELRGKRVLAFAGIGDPGKFFATLRTIGAEPEREIAFPDHHPFAPADAEHLLTAAGQSRLQLVTTEKDLARMRGNAALAALAGASLALPVSLEFADVSAMTGLLQKKLAR